MTGINLLSLASAMDNADYVLVDGVVGGVWQRQVRGKQLAMRVDAFGGLSAEQRAEVEQQAQRIAAFLGRAVQVSFGEVAARAHL